MKTYLFVSPYFPTPENWRGGYGYDLVKAIVKTGLYDRVAVFKPGEGLDYRCDVVDVYRFKTYWLPGGIYPLFFANRNVASFRAAVARAGIDVQDVAVCHCNNVFNSIHGLALKLENPKIKVLLHHHDLASFGVRTSRLRNCLIHKIPLYFSARRLLQAVDLNVFISEKCKESCLRFPDTSWSVYEDYRKLGRGIGWLPCVPLKNTYVLHNGVDTSLFKPAARGTDPTAARGTGPLVIGCIGNFEALKDQISLIRAVERLDFSVRVIFIGSGPTLEKCRAEAARVTAAKPKATFEFRAEVRHELLPAFYHELDLFVLPSYFEGFGCVYTEAWSCGVPFIACEGQGIEDLIASGDRALWLARPRDPADLAAKIAHFHARRPVQRLTGEVDIRKLVAEFVAKGVSMELPVDADRQKPPFAEGR